MANFSGKPQPIGRFLGYMDEDDPTNLPVGIASLCRNTEFTYTSARTRAGVNLTMKGVNRSPITGILGAVYLPQGAGETAFQLPLVFDLAGSLQYESPLGSGRMNRAAYATFTPAAGAHMIGAQAYNRAYLSFSDLKSPKGGCGVFDLKTNTLDPLGQKPFGWAWITDTPCAVGEMATPSQVRSGTAVSVGNGHTYRCIQAGTTGAAQPVWPLTEGVTVADGSVVWQEYTMVLANRLPTPSAPMLARFSGGGSFAAGRDVYVAFSLLNGQGETLLGVASFLANTAANDAVNVTIPALASMPGWVQGLAPAYAVSSIGIYEADVATGSPPPALEQFQRAGTSAPGASVGLTASIVSGVYPQAASSARITSGMLPAPTAAPIVTRASGAGTFAAGRDIWVRQAYTNTLGETALGPSSSIVGTQASDAVKVEVDALAGYAPIGVNLYEADVTSGAAEPDVTEYALAGSYQPGATATLTSTAFGRPASTSNTTGAGGSVVADKAAGGINNTQGYRYAVCSFQNRNGSNSGITSGSVVQTVIDENGWELAVFNVATGPANVAKRIIGFAVADGVPVGPFGYLSASLLSDGIQVLASVIADNATTQTVVNFTDDQLLAAIAAGSSLTDRFDTLQPYPCVDLYYSPSTNRFFQTGAPGFPSSHLVSQAGDAESYQGSTCEIAIGADGERTVCVREFTNGTLFSLRERSGFVISPSTADPRTWSAAKRWGKVGPCGPRAVDVAGDFLLFVHRSGIYRYDGSGEPERVSKENPHFWSTVNWAAQETIWCTIDMEAQTVHVGLPTGRSAVPNVEYAINYEEGWAYPIHFSTYSGKTIAVDGCRKTSINDIAAFVGERIERTLPQPIDPAEQAAGVPQRDGAFYASQFVYGSSAADGALHAITPGTFSDNGAGIDWRYRTVSTDSMQALSKCEGFNLNARGSGTIDAAFLSGRDIQTDDGSGPIATRTVRARSFDLSPEQSAGISRNVESRVNEHWMMEFSNGKRPDVWAELKSLTVYMIPLYAGRTGGEG